jgi:hypothetical protein
MRHNANTQRIPSKPPKLTALDTCITLGYEYELSLACSVGGGGRSTQQTAGCHADAHVDICSCVFLTRDDPIGICLGTQGTRIDVVHTSNFLGIERQSFFVSAPD